MEIWNNKLTQEIIETLLAEQAKAANELSCAQRDTLKAMNRIRFCGSALQELNNRYKGE